MSETIEFCPIISGLEKIEPIVTAKEFNKNLDFSREEFSIRSCPGIRDLINTGYVIPLWQDILIKYSDNQGVDVIPSGNMVDQNGQPFHDIQFHGERELAGYSFGDQYFNFTMKIRCPWYVKTQPGTHILLIPSFYNEHPHFTVASGIVTSDVYPMILAQVVLKKFKGEILLKKGTPLMQIIAIKSQPELKIYDNDVIISKSIDKLKNWMYSKMHAASQYRNIKKIFK